MKIVIPKQKNIVIEDEIHVRYSGHIQLEKANVDADGVEIPGTRRVAVPWFKNTITNIGLNAKGTGIQPWCVVGTGTNAIVNGTLTLTNYLASQDSQPASTHGIVTDETGTYGYIRNTHRFLAGNGTGVISELGLTIEGDINARNIFCGSLVKDALGNPTTITKLADELLDVLYEVRMYAKETDDVYTVNINGNNHTFRTRAEVVDASTWGAFMFIEYGHYPFQEYYEDVTLGSLGDIHSRIGGSSIAAVQSSNPANDSYYEFSPYVNNTLYREVIDILGPQSNDRNINISGLVRYTPVGVFKTFITPNIVKPVGTSLQTRLRYYWSRK